MLINLSFICLILYKDINQTILNKHYLGWKAYKQPYLCQSSSVNPCSIQTVSYLKQWLKKKTIIYSGIRTENELVLRKI